MCAAGQYRGSGDSDTSTCLDCKVGYYIENGGQGSCLPCIRKFYTCTRVFWTTDGIPFSNFSFFFPPQLASIKMWQARKNANRVLKTPRVINPTEQLPVSRVIPVKLQNQVKPNADLMSHHIKSNIDVI